MDMGTSTMSMAMSSITSSGAGAATTSPMSMSMSMGSSSCKISMLWNWYTIDACFISQTWHITSHGMFAGSCIGVILLVMSLEFLRRLGKEYDRYILRQHQRAATTVYNSQAGAAKTDSDNGVNEHRALTPGSTAPASFRSNAIQQAVHATLHMVQFAVAYFVMLLAMYYNGYFIIALLLGRGWALLSLAGKVLVMPARRKKLLFVADDDSVVPGTASLPVQM